MRMNRPNILFILSDDQGAWAMHCAGARELETPNLDRIAAEVRADNKAKGTFMVNVMASPGAGKTTTLLRTIKELGREYKIGVMEADIEATVDADKMAEAGVQAMQIHTGGECAMDASMTQAALNEFNTSDLDIVFLEKLPLFNPDGTVKED